MNGSSNSHAHTPGLPGHASVAHEGEPPEEDEKFAVLAWIDRLLPESARTDRDAQRRSRLLVACSIGFAVVCFFFATQMLLAGRYPMASVITLYGGMVAALFNIPLIKWTRGTIVPGTLLCLESTFLIAYQAFNDTGMMDPTLLWNLLLPWMAAFLIGPVFGFIFAGVVVLMTSGFYFLQISGYPFPMYSTQEEVWLFYLWCMSGIALFIGFIGWIYEGQTLRDLRESNDRLREARDALKVSNQRTINILESITNGFFAINDNDEFQYINKQAERLLDASRSELLSSGIAQYFQSEDGQKLLDELHAAKKHWEPRLSEIYFGEVSRWFEFHIYPYAAGTSVFFSDITSRKNYERQLVDARRKAEEVARVKSQLLTNMSHEIRTPLTAILGFARILGEEATGDHQEFGELIEQNGERLMATLNSVLDLAQLEDPHADIELRPVDLRTEAADAVHMFENSAENKGLNLSMDLKGSSFMALADDNYVNRILVNLLGNAVKFTEEGGVRLTLIEQADEIILRVSDTGKGIAPEFLPHIFDEFRQESTGLSREHEGNGLGLAITRRLTERMDGTIEVESEQGRGTTFTVRFNPAREEVPASQA